MLWNDLREYLKKLDEVGELKHVNGVDWNEELGAIAEIMTERRGPAVLFDEIKGYPRGFRVASNVFSTPKRTAIAFGLSPEPGDNLAQRWADLMGTCQPVAPQVVTSGPVLENVMTGDSIDLFKFPTPKWHEQDIGRYIGTGVCVIQNDPDTRFVNVGAYRVAVHDKNTCTIFIEHGKHGDHIRHKYWKQGKKCPVVVSVGQEPVLTALSGSGIYHCPDGVSEFEVAGYLHKSPYPIVRGTVTGIPMPASAEIVIEGFIPSPQEAMEMEGPFGEWTGYYASASREEPVIQVQRVYYRDNPIIVGSPPTRPPDEQARYRAFLRSAVMFDQLEQAGVPDIQGVWCHEVGGSRLWVAVSIQQRYPGHARQVGHLAASVRAGGYLGRYVIVVDEDIDPTSLEEVVWAMCTRSDPARSIDVMQRAWSGPLDPAIRPGEKGFNSRAIIDATRPFEWRDEFPPVSAMSRERREEAMRRWGHLL